MLVLTFLSVGPIRAAVSGVDPEVEACIRKNAPESTAIQHIQLRSEGPLFEEKILNATVYVKQLSDGHSQLLTVFKDPEEV